MSSEDDRTVVQTYVPSYQKARWKEHADQLGMSQSEFVRTMVQAGRAEFPIPSKPNLAAVTPGGDGGETGLQNESSNQDESSRNNDELSTRVIDALQDDAHLSWDNLVSALTDDIEDRLESTLQELQSSGRVVYSGRQGGYTLVGEDGR